MFFCLFCDYNNSELSIYLQHLKEHSNLTKLFICGYNHCNKAYSILSSLQTHVYRTHQVNTTRHESSAASTNTDHFYEEINCTVESCTQKYRDIKKLKEHLYAHIKQGITVKCYYPNCEKKYRLANSFSSHISKVHKKDKVLKLAQLNDDNNVHSSDLFTINHENPVDELFSHAQCEKDNYHHEEKNNSDENFLMNLAHFFLKLEFKFCLPASTVQYIASEICKMSAQNQKLVKNNLSKHLQELNLSAESIENILYNVLDKTFNTVDENLGTIYKRKKFYEKNFPYVSPIQIPLDNSSGKKKRFYHYVPLKETIKQLYNNKSLSHKLVFDLPKNDSRILKDFTDGSVFKNNEFFKNNPNAIQLILYQDSFEIVNPIGSAKAKYKILAVYLSIGNYPDNIRSHVNSMYLVALCKEKIFDHTKVFGRIVQDLKDIETDGIEISPGEVVKGSLVFVTGDNLGSHALGGFAENFSKTQYFCRYCLVTKKSFETANGVFKNYPIRTVESYKKVINQLNRNKYSCLQKKANQKPLLIKGIKFNSAFNQLDYYHVCLPGLPPCLGHDIFEGVLAYDLKLFLDDLVDKGWFSYKLLNHRIEIFDYSVEDQRDKLCSISSTSQRVSGGACQIWNFLRLLPLLIYDKIDDIDDDVWECILLLSEIVEIVCAPAIHETFVIHLDSLIRDYIYLRKSLFLQPLRPKHHYFFHYSSLILRFGPLMKSWTLRSESKHCFFKRSMRYLHNFINVTKSLSTKHELYQCFVRLGGEISSDFEVKNTEKFNLNLYNEMIKKILLTKKLHPDTVECHEIIKTGVSYRIGDGLFISQGGYQYKIVVGRICKILNDGNEVYFILEVLDTKFIPYLRAYKLGEVLEYKCLSSSELVSFQKLHVYRIGSILCIKPKYALVECAL